MVRFGRGRDQGDDEPVSRYFPVVTPSRREDIERQRQRNAGRAAAEEMWGPILARLQDYARTLVFVRHR